MGSDQKERPRPWIAWPPSITRILSFIALLLGAGFSGVYICNNTVCGPEPVLNAIDPSEVAPGDEAGLIGEDLNLIFEVYLSSLEREPIRIYHKPQNEQRLTVAVPRSVPPGEYWLEARWRKPIPAAWPKTLVEDKYKMVVKDTPPPVTPTPLPPQPTYTPQPTFAPLPIYTPQPTYPPPALNTCPDDPIVFADLDWPSVQIQSAVAKFILKEGYGCEIDGIEGSSTPLFQSLVNGNLHVFMELWLPNYQEEWKEAIRQGSIIPLGRSLDDQWQSTFVVPTYVIKGDTGRGIEPMAPDLNTPEDLRRYKDLFATSSSGGKAVLVNCIEGWNCKDINRQKVESYGLEEVITLEVPLTADALIKSLEDAYELGEPWLGYLWGPTETAHELDLTLLEELPFSKACWETHKRCTYGDADVMKAVNPSLVAQAPEIFEFLRKWHLDADIQIIGESHNKETGESFKETAVWFLRTQEAVWTQWVPRDVADKVKEALNKP